MKSDGITLNIFHTWHNYRMIQFRTNIGDLNNTWQTDDRVRKVIFHLHYLSFFIKGWDIFDGKKAALPAKSWCVLLIAQSVFPCHFTTWNIILTIKYYMYLVCMESTMENSTNTTKEKKKDLRNIKLLII